MAGTCSRCFFALIIGMMLFGCAAQQQDMNTAETNAYVGGSGTAGSVPLPAAGTDGVVNPDTLNFGQYMEENVDNFLVILDASGSKFLPYKQQIKLKVAKDILRRFNKKTPERPLFGGLRRYGWEAGAFSTSTSLLFGMDKYNREKYAEAIEIVRWAGGKSPLSMAMDRAGDDLSLAPMDEYLALVIISDGKIKKADPDPVMAARRIKQRYGDRICIYTVAVGDDLPFEKKDVKKGQKRYHEKFKLLRNIAKEGNCGYMVTSDDLVPEDNMNQFVHDVFTRGHTLGPCLDEDEDGVCDDVDKCPGTPKGAKVDENGCWILGKVQFDLNKWNIKPEYRAMLDEIANVLVLNPDMKLAVQGHTCTIWTEEYNMKLSHWRAMSVVTYLVNRGARQDQLEAEGFGFHAPFASNDTEEGRSLNRRAEFRRLQ